MERHLNFLQLTHAYIFSDMKRIIAFTSLLFCWMPLQAQLVDMIEMPDDTDVEFDDEDLLKTWGWLLAQRFNLTGFDFNEAEMEYIFEGMSTHVKGAQAPTVLDDSMTKMQQYFADREQRTVVRQLAENKKKEIDFFDTLFGLPDVQMLGTGLYYQIIEEGGDARPSETDVVIVHYEGRFLDNTIFDSSDGRPPVAFKMAEIIPGWTQGLRLIGEGGKIKLYVPSKLGYGDEPRSGIPPGSALVFEISLVRIGLPEGDEIPE